MCPFRIPSHLEVIAFPMPYVCLEFDDIRFKSQQKRSITTGYQNQYFLENRYQLNGINQYEVGRICWSLKYIYFMKKTWELLQNV